MIGLDTFLIILVLVVGFYMSWNIGANDVANAMGTSVGSKALTLKKAVLIAAILEFSGALILGSNVSETLQSGLIKTDFFIHDPTHLLIGMLSALLATSIWLQIASYFGWPVSTTHAIVGAIIGFGCVVGGVQAIHWPEVWSVASSWVLSPLLSGVISFMIFTFLQKTILFAANPIYAAKKMAPILVMMVISVFCIGTGFDGLEHFDIFVRPSLVIFGALVVGVLCGFVAKLLFSKAKVSTIVPSSGTIRGSSQILSLSKAIKHLQRVRLTSSGDMRASIAETIKMLRAQIESIKIKIDSKPTRQSDFRAVEDIFAYLQIISACFVAFAHGANDVANAIGPVASVIQIIRHPEQVNTTAEIPYWLLMLGGLGIVLGLATWGWRVIETIGRKITELTPSRGFCAEFGAATTILIASKLGLPISTTHCIVGSVLGIGMAKGISALNLRMVRDIVLSWIITIPSSAVTCIIFYYLINFLVGSFSLI